jgi:hypothetical protein
VAAAVTVSVAALLVALPTELVTMTVKLDPLSPMTAAGVVYPASVAPAIGLPFFCHWYCNGAVPTAVTLKVALCPVLAV